MPIRGKHCKVGDAWTCLQCPKVKTGFAVHPEAGQSSALQSILEVIEWQNVRQHKFEQFWITDFCSLFTDISLARSIVKRTTPHI